MLTVDPVVCTLNRSQCNIKLRVPKIVFTHSQQVEQIDDKHRVHVLNVVVVIKNVVVNDVVKFFGHHAVVVQHIHVNLHVLLRVAVK